MDRETYIQLDRIEIKIDQLLETLTEELTETEKTKEKPELPEFSMELSDE